MRDAHSLILDALPYDVVHEIFRYLDQANIATVARTSRSNYKALQPLLWRRPNLYSHRQLTLFINYLYRVPVLLVPPIEQWDKVCWARQNQVRFVHIEVPGGPGFDELTSEKVQKLARLCPQAEITLRFSTGVDAQTLTEDPKKLFPGVHTMHVSELYGPQDSLASHRRPWPVHHHPHYTLLCEYDFWPVELRITQE